MGGNKMRYGLFLLLSLFMWQACDVEDKGNYDYDYQNGVTITFADGEMNQTLEKGVDTLKIHPTVEGDIYGDNEDNYEYKWFFCSPITSDVGLQFFRRGNFCIKALSFEWSFRQRAINY